MMSLSTGRRRHIAASLLTLASLALLVVMAYRMSRPRGLIGEVVRRVPALARTFERPRVGFVAAAGSGVRAVPSVNGAERGRTLRSTAPATATGVLRVGAVSADVESEVTFVGARPSPVRVEQGVVVYPEAYESTDILAVQDPAGLEILYYVRDPSVVPELALQVRRGSAGDRLEVEATTGDAILRSAGARAELRITHPVLVDSKGVRRAGKFDVHGSELRLALSWDGLAAPVVVDPSIVIPFWTLSSDARAPGAAVYDFRGHLTAEAKVAYDEGRDRLVLVRPTRSRQPADRYFLFGDPVDEGSLQRVAASPRPVPPGVPVGERERADWARTVSGMETWEWDGSMWSRSSGTALPLRIEPALAYSPALGRTILFGGATRVECNLLPPTAQCHFPQVIFGEGGSDASATYEYDGAGWRAKHVAEGPPPRVRGSMSRFGNGVLLFGGRALGAATIIPQAEAFPDSMASALLNDTWLYDGERWVQVPVAHAPPPSEADQLVYDSRRSVAVLVVGGDNPFAGPVSVWEFDGMDWLERAPPSAIRSRNGIAAFWDPAREKVELFGGSAKVFDGCPFTGSDLTNRIAAARKSVLATDQLAAAGCLGGYQHDLWEWDGTAFAQRTRTAFGGYVQGTPVFRQVADASPLRPPTPPADGSTVPPAALQTPQWPWRSDRRANHFELRSSLERAYQASTGTTAGVPTEPSPAPSPTPTGEQTPPAPSFVSPLFAARTRPNIAYSVARGRFQIFTPGDGEVLETDGAAWQSRTPADTPFATGQRDFLAATWDSARNRALAFDPTTGRTWTYQDGAGWAPLAPAASPPPWSAPANIVRLIDLPEVQNAEGVLSQVPKMVFDRARARVVMLHRGGTWEFDGSTWVRSAPAPAGWSSCVAGTNLAYDGQRQVTVAFGCRIPGETWEWDGSSWRGPLAGPYQATVARLDPDYQAERFTSGVMFPNLPWQDADELRSEWSGTLQLAWAHPNAAVESAALGGITTTDADGTLRTWDGTAWKPGPKLPDGYACNAARIRQSAWFGQYPDPQFFWHESRQIGNLVGLPTCFFPPLIQDAVGKRLIALRDGPRGMLELDLSDPAHVGSWHPVTLGNGGGDWLGGASGFAGILEANDAVFPLPFELYSAEHALESAQTDASTQLFLDGTRPSLPADAFWVSNWHTRNLFWPFKMLQDPSTGRVRLLTNRGAVCELGGEPVAGLGEPCTTSNDCGAGYCGREEVCCDDYRCGSVACSTCLGTNPGHCEAVPAAQPDPVGICGTGECAAGCSGNLQDSFAPRSTQACVYVPSRLCGPATSCSAAALTPRGHCSPVAPSCIPPDTAVYVPTEQPVPACPVVDGQLDLTSFCSPHTAPCPAGLKCADATSCLPLPHVVELPGGGSQFVGGCETRADCAPGFGYCDPETRTCLPGGCETRADCTSKFDGCDVTTHLCAPDHASVLAQALGIQPSTYVPPHRRTRQELADIFAQAGFERDDQGRIVHPGADLGGYPLAFDPSLRIPRLGLAACFERIRVCLNPVDGHAGEGLDSCVAGLPRCVTNTPWDGNDPSGEDCCPEACVASYMEARQQFGHASAADVFSISGCYPGVPGAGP